MAGEQITFKQSVRYYKINGIAMYDGLIDNNPFYSVLTLTKAAQWILQNPGPVYGKIRKDLRMRPNQQVSYGIDLKDIYEYVLNYYIENPQKDFQEYYMGEDGNYHIAQYVLSSITRIIHQMRNKDDMAKLGPVLGIVEDNQESEGYQPLTVRESVASMYEEDQRVVDTPYYIEVYSYLVLLVREALRDNSLTPEYIFDLVFQSVTEIPDEDIYERYQTTELKWNNARKRLVEDEELAAHIKEQIQILAEPIAYKVFSEQDFAELELDE